MVRATKQKEDWKQKGAEIYFIDADLSHTLFEGRIETVNGDGTFVVRVVSKRIDDPKEEIVRTIHGSRLKPSKS